MDMWTAGVSGNTEVASGNVSAAHVETLAEKSLVVTVFLWIGLRGAHKNNPLPLS
jgi:hypothetical protein